MWTEYVVTYTSRAQCPAPKRSLQLLGASIVRIVSLHSFRLCESMSETSAINADCQQLMNRKVYLREIIKIISDKTQSTFMITKSGT